MPKPRLALQAQDVRSVVKFADSVNDFEFAALLAMSCLLLLGIPSEALLLQAYGSQSEAQCYCCVFTIILKTQYKIVQAT